MDRDKLLEGFKSDVRSILLSAPCGVPKPNFRRDYKGLIGSDPPLRQLGYPSMDEFIRENPDVVTQRIGPTGEMTYYAVSTAETNRVASLISRQKKPSLQKLRKAVNKPHPPMSRGVFSSSAPPPKRSMRPVRRGRRT